MSKSDEIVKVDMVKLFYVNGRNWTAARRALSKKYRQENSSCYNSIIPRAKRASQLELLRGEKN